jgi:hypothetical protein
MEGSANQGIPRDGAALANYEAGYAAGTADAHAAAVEGGKSVLDAAKHIVQGVVEGATEIAKDLGHIESPVLPPIPEPEFRDLKRELGIGPDPDDGA